MKSDIPTKRVLQVRPIDWIRFILPDVEVTETKELNTVLISKLESRIDNLQLINNQFILHIEPNGYKDNAIPARMLRYRADIWEHTISHGMGTPSIKQVLLLFYEKHDNNQHKLCDNWDDDITIDYKYRVIKVWEIPFETIIYKKLIGLYPLLPIMKYDKGETPDKILARSIETAFTIIDGALRADILSAMAILAEGIFSNKIIENHIRREMLMESTLFMDYAKDYAKEYAKEEREKGKLEGKLEGKIEVAKKMIVLGINISDIADVTGLDTDKINELKGKLM